VTLWFLSSEFDSLALGSKVVVIGLHILGVVLVVLWGRWLDVKLSRRVTTFPLKNEAEESKGATSGQNENYSV